MIDFAHNPYRILGVFGNDSLRTRTANVARIRAFAKVGKLCAFPSDLTNIFGPVDRSESSIDKAISQLSLDEDAQFYSCLWVNRSSQLATDVCTCDDLVLIGSKGKELADWINAFIGAYGNRDFDLAAEYFLRIIDMESIGEAVKKRMLLSLCDDFCRDTEVNTPAWWKRFKKLCTASIEDAHVPSFLLIIKTCHEKCIEFLNNCTKEVYDVLNLPTWWDINDLHKKAQSFRRAIQETGNPMLNHTLFGMDIILSKDMDANGQLACSNYAKAAFRNVQLYYENTQLWEAHNAFDVSDFLFNLSDWCHSEELREMCESYSEKVRMDAYDLAPDEVLVYARKIRGEIYRFCAKPDKTRWALKLVNNCVPYLISIKCDLPFCDQRYYMAISTKIADNALYACENDLSEAQGDYETDSADESLKSYLLDALRDAAQLVANLEKYSLKDDFVEDKFEPFKERLSDYLSRHLEFEIGEIKPTISLLSEDEVYAACQDYDELVAYMKRYPQGIHVKEAQARINDIEDQDYPEVQSPITLKYIEELLAYKEKYPCSHNDAKLLSELGRLLVMQSSIWSAEALRKQLRLWPNCQHVNLLKTRLESLVFSQCRNKEDWQRYLQDYPQGRYRQQAAVRIQQKIEEENMNELFACKTIHDFELFAQKCPKGALHDCALAQIELLTYQESFKSGHHESYLRKYPKGRYAKTIEQKNAWMSLKNNKSRRKLKQYISLFPDSRYAVLAKHLIRRRNQNFMFFPLGFIVLVCLAIWFYNVGQNAGNVSDQSSEPAAVADTTVAYADSDAYNEGTFTPTSETGEDTGVASDPFNDTSHQYADNSLATGSKPYAEYLGRAHTGRNHFEFKTSAGNDYVVIIKKSTDGSYVNHTYIRGGETARLYVPNGTYMVYFYSGYGWNPNKPAGNCLGGFEYASSITKDGPVKLRSAYMEYTLYPVQNGNLRLKDSNENEAL